MCVEVARTKVDKGVVDEVVKGDLAKERAYARRIRHLLGQRLVREARHAGPQLLEDVDVEKPLQAAKVAAAKEGEDGVALPGDLLTPLDVTLHQVVARRRLHRRHHDVELVWLRARKPQDATAARGGCAGRCGGCAAGRDGRRAHLPPVCSTRREYPPGPQHGPTAYGCRESRHG